MFVAFCEAELPNDGLAFIEHKRHCLQCRIESTPDDFPHTQSENDDYPEYDDEARAYAWPPETLSDGPELASG